MIVDNLDVESIAILPPEADAPLLVNADAVLARAVAFECLELIRWGNHKIAQIHGAVEVLQLLACALLNLVVQALYELALEYRFRVLVLESPDHGKKLNVPRYYRQALSRIPAEAITWPRADIHWSPIEAANRRLSGHHGVSS